MDIALEMAVLDADRYVLAMPRGEIDAYTGPAFRKHLLDAIDSRPLIIDMSDVSFVDCAVLKAIIAADRRCRERGTALAVTGLRSSTEQVFRLGRIGDLIAVCHTVQEAVWCVVPLSDKEIATWS
jgi:anti-anti-sigma factor